MHYTPIVLLNRYQCRCSLQYARVLKISTPTISCPACRRAEPFYRNDTPKSKTVPCKWISVYNADAEKECMINPVGRGYLGTTNVSSSGLPCLPWDKVIEDGVIKAPLIPDSNGRHAQNYCRYIPGQNWTSPSCFVNAGGSDFNYIVNQTCSIPFCGKVDLMLTVFVFRKS